MSAKTKLTFTEVIKEVNAKSKKKPNYSNTAVSQRNRLLQEMRVKKGKGISRFYCLEILGIIHPSARILELRRAGHQIITDWCYERDTNNVIHRIGLFKLIKEAT